MVVYSFSHLNTTPVADLLPSLLSVPACSIDVADEKGYMSDVETALQEYTIIFNGIIR